MLCGRWRRGTFRRGRSNTRPPFEQGGAIELHEALHFFRAGVEIVLEHANGGVDFVVAEAISGELKRASHDPPAVNSMFDVELVENAGHARRSCLSVNHSRMSAE